MGPAEPATLPRPIVLQTQRHLKWRSFDRIEHALMVLCGVFLVGFATTVFLDITTRTIGHPWLWLQEVTSIQFIWGIFTGAAVATRRNDHLLLSAITESLTGRLRMAVELMNRAVVLGAGCCMVYFGYINFLQGFGSFRMPSLTPIAYWYLAIPISGAFIALFTVEQIANGWRNGFESDAERLDAIERSQDGSAVP
ncbi:MAG TPA: TRAP transporter small permease [Candidatus Cybelea sp.]|nr:TRAP transporter small permease [Candidatus Cybelea sp.]